MLDPDELRGYLDREGRLSQWPAKPHKRLLALEYLAEKFEIDRSYSEREVNELLKAWHTFSDWALLRRELVDQGFLRRPPDCMEYWKIPPDASDLRP